jgi:glutamyl-tRNA synthetase
MNIQLPKLLKKALDATVSSGHKIKVRFPPEPSGYLHLGHAKAIYYNYLIAQKYKVDFVVRMDDTNPRKESMEYEEAIFSDIRNILKITEFTCSRTSDYFSQILQSADHLVEKGLAYVDSTPSEVMKTERFDGVVSQCRNQSLLVNQDLWTKLKSGMVTDSCLRIKLDMSAKNKCLRDPVIYRPVEGSHYSKDPSALTYKVYPTYDFACPLVDIFEGITHVFRNQEFLDRDDQYKAIVKLLGLECPYLDYYSRLEFDGVQMGKRHMKTLIESGQAHGWDDPKLWTLRGLQRRGLHLDALLEFVQIVAFSRSSGVKIEQDLLWHLNRKVIDKVSGRYVALGGILTTHQILIGDDATADDPDLHTQKSVQLFHRNPQLGSKSVYYRQTILLTKEDSDALKEGEEVTLMNYGNVIYTTGQFQRHLTGDFKATEKKVVWLPSASDVRNVPMLVIDPQTNQPPIGYLGEPDLVSVKNGDFVQFMKLGYFRCDHRDSDGCLIFFPVP